MNTLTNRRVGIMWAALLTLALVMLVFPPWDQYWGVHRAGAAGYGPIWSGPFTYPSNNIYRIDFLRLAIQIAAVVVAGGIASLTMVLLRAESPT